MALRVFDDRAHEPEPDGLRAALGRAPAARAEGLPAGLLARIDAAPGRRRRIH